MFWAAGVFGLARETVGGICRRNGAVLVSVQEGRLYNGARFLPQSAPTIGLYQRLCMLYLRCEVC